jgi:hypothetical protein
VVAAEEPLLFAATSEKVYVVWEERTSILYPEPLENVRTTTISWVFVVGVAVAV